MARDLEHQPAVAAAELEDAQRPRAGFGRVTRVQRAREDAARAHEGVDAAQVAARALRRRIVGRQVVERLRLEDARQHARRRRHDDQSTRSSAPWQLKPAPNDDSHHQPPGASSASAASSTK